MGVQVRHRRRTCRLLVPGGGIVRSAYRGLALLICLGVAIQAAAIAFGWFDVLNESDTQDVVINDDWELNAGHLTHSIMGTGVIPLLGLLLLASSFFTKVVGASKWAGIVLGSIVFQVVLGIVAFSAPIAGVLHGLNAFVLFGVALMAARRMDVSSPATTPAGRESASV